MTDFPGDNSPETWHLCEPSDAGWGWGINCDLCFTGRGFALQAAPLVGTVPGGHNDTYGSAQYKFQANFDKGLDEYKKARDEGLQPKATTVEAVREAQETVKSQRRAVKKLGLEEGEALTAAGVFE